MNVLIIGDSHVGALQQAHLKGRETEKALAPANLTIRPLGNGKFLATPFFADHGDYAELANGEYRQQFRRFPPQDHAYDWIGFSGPLHLARVWRNLDWERFSPWNMGGREHAISTAMLEQAIEDDAKHALGFIDVIRRTTRIFVIESPWPFRHHPAVSHNGPELVHRVHEQYRRYVLEELERRHVPVVTIDPAWCDAEGFMRERFRHGNPEDTHHGNIEFGCLMLERIGAFLRENAQTGQLPDAAGVQNVMVSLKER